MANSRPKTSIGETHIPSSSTDNVDGGETAAAINFETVTDAKEFLEASGIINVDGVTATIAHVEAKGEWSDTANGAEYLIEIFHHALHCSIDGAAQYVESLQVEDTDELSLIGKNLGWTLPEINAIITDKQGGKGGMGEIVCAVCPNSGEYIAIKFYGIPAGESGNLNRMKEARFKVEPSFLRQMHGTGIMPSYIDKGTLVIGDMEFHWYAMEMIRDGIPMNDLIKIAHDPVARATKSFMSGANVDVEIVNVTDETDSQVDLEIAPSQHAAEKELSIDQGKAGTGDAVTEDMDQHGNGLDIHDLERVDSINAIDVETGVDTPLPMHFAVDSLLIWLRYLQVMRDKGLIHRDLKPGNIMLQIIEKDGKKKGKYRIVDPGIARTLTDVTMTEANTGMGTTPYAAPELLKDAHSATSQADLYCLAASIWHLVTGKIPIKGDDGVAIMAQHLAGIMPDISEMGNTETGKALGELLMQMLRKEPDERGDIDELVKRVFEISGLHAQYNGDFDAFMSTAAADLAIELPNIDKYHRAPRNELRSRFDSDTIFSAIVDNELPEANSPEVRLQRKKTRGKIVKLAMGTGMALVFLVSVAGLYFAFDGKKWFQVDKAVATGEDNSEVVKNPLIDESENAQASKKTIEVPIESAKILPPKKYPECSTQVGPKKEDTDVNGVYTRVHPVGNDYLLINRNTNDDSSYDTVTGYQLREGNHIIVATFGDTKSYTGNSTVVSGKDADVDAYRAIADVPPVESQGQSKRMLYTVQMDENHTVLFQENDDGNSPIILFTLPDESNSLVFPNLASFHQYIKDHNLFPETPHVDTAYKQPVKSKPEEEDVDYLGRGIRDESDSEDEIQYVNTLLAHIFSPNRSEKFAAQK